MKLAANHSEARTRIGPRAKCAWLLLSLLATAGRARAEDPDAAPPRALNPVLAAGLWTAAQLIPSPLYVASEERVGGGVRWQLTPLLYSFGVAAKPFRSFVIEPVARHSGAVELFVSPEWACCAPRGKTSWLARAGARVYLPLALSGESLCGSFGGSYAFASPRGSAGFELGIYTLSSILGLKVTVAPWLTDREGTVALSLHYF